MSGRESNPIFCDSNETIKSDSNKTDTSESVILVSINGVPRKGPADFDTALRNQHRSVDSSQAKEMEKKENAFEDAHPLPFTKQSGRNLKHSKTETLSGDYSKKNVEMRNDKGRKKAEKKVKSTGRAISKSKGIRKNQGSMMNGMMKQPLKIEDTERADFGEFQGGGNVGYSLRIPELDRIPDEWSTAPESSKKHEKAYLYYGGVKYVDAKDATEMGMPQLRESDFNKFSVLETGQFYIVGKVTKVKELYYPKKKSTCVLNLTVIGCTRKHNNPNFNKQSEIHEYNVAFWGADGVKYSEELEVGMYIAINYTTRKKTFVHGMSYTPSPDSVVVLDQNAKMIAELREFIDHSSNQKLSQKYFKSVHLGTRSNEKKIVNLREEKIEMQKQEKIDLLSSNDWTNLPVGLQEIRDKYNRKDEKEECNRQYLSVIPKTQLKNVNLTEPFLFREKKLSPKEHIELWNDLEATGAGHSKHFKELRFGGLPRFGVHIGRYPPVGTFKNPLGNGNFYRKNPLHKHAMCFDLPATAGSKARAVDQRDPDGCVICRKYRFKNCPGVGIRITEFARKEDKKNAKSTWISTRKTNFFLVHIFLDKKSRIDQAGSGENIKPRMSMPPKPVRNNPIALAEAAKNASIMSVSQSVKKVKREVFVQGPVDQKISASSIHSQRSQEKYRDNIKFVLQEIKNPSDGIKFIQDISVSHSKSGLLIFSSLLSIPRLCNVLRSSFPNFSMQGYVDSTFEKAGGYLVELLVKIPCLIKKTTTSPSSAGGSATSSSAGGSATSSSAGGSATSSSAEGSPFYAPFGFLYTNFDDQESYDHFFLMLERFTSLRSLPNIYMKDDCDAMQNSLEKVGKKMANEGMIQLVTLLCLWHMSRNVKYFCKEKLMFTEEKIGRACHQFEKLSYSKTLEELHVNIPIVRNLIISDLKSSKLWDYINKNKLRKIETMIFLLNDHPLLIGGSDQDRHNHPIESNFRLIDEYLRAQIAVTRGTGDVGRKKDASLKDLLMALKNLSIDKELEIMKAIAGMESEYEFTEDSQRVFGGSMESMSEYILPQVLRQGTRVEQNELLRRLSSKLPDLLESAGYIIIPNLTPKFKFNTDLSKFKKKLPFDVGLVAKKANLKIDVKKVTEKCLIYLNNSGSVLPMSKNQTSFYSLSSSYQEYLTVGMWKNGRFSCPCHPNEFCFHGFVHLMVSHDLDLFVECALKYGTTIDSMFPELNIRGGLKKGKKKKKQVKDEERLVKSFGLAKADDKKYLGRDRLLFKSPVHKRKLYLCCTNLEVYHTDELKKLCKSHNFRKYSGLNRRDLVNFVYEKLCNFARLKCVFCGDGELGYCCSDCEMYKYLYDFKGTDDLERIGEKLNSIFSHEDIDMLCSSYRDLFKKLVCCISIGGNIIDEVEYNKTLYTIYGFVDKAKRIILEKSIVKQKFQELGYELYSSDTNADGDCMFDSVRLEAFRRYGVELTVEQLRISAATWLMGNRFESFGDGLVSCT